MLKVLYNSVSSRFGTGIMKIKAASPEIMLAGGLAAGVASVVMIARAHKKAQPVLDGLKEDLENMDEYFDEYNGSEPEEVINEHAQIRAKAEVVGIATANLIKLYGPGTLMGIGGVMLILGSHGMMKRRAQALIGLATLLEGSFKKYRERVKEEYGPEAEARIFHGAETRPVTVLSEKDGKKSKKKVKKNHIPEEPDPGIYSRVFDQTNKNWDPDPDRNIYGLYAIQQQAHDKLVLRGHLVLNEVYRDLGFEETDYGAIVGWTLNGDGDGYVDFGLDDDINKREGDNRWIISPNVDGVIWDLIGHTNR